MNKRYLAFLSMDNLEGFVSDDELAIAPLQAREWEVHTVSWRQSCDWSRYDLVVIRTTWDYQNNVNAFLEVLSQIQTSGAVLQNNLNVVKWNIEKTYLQELEKKGNSIVQTIWGESLPSIKIFQDYFRHLQCDELIIKPVVSANADFTYRVRRENLKTLYPQLQVEYENRPFMIQPFMPNILSEGEYSLFYFNGAYSHAILKTPKKHDFRVQEEHGGLITSVQPESVLKSNGEKVLQSLTELPLYARVDFVRNSGAHFEIMEVELIEPALYFRTDAASAERFAAAVDEGSWK